MVAGRKLSSRILTRLSLCPGCVLFSSYKDTSPTGSEPSHLASWELNHLFKDCPQRQPCSEILEGRASACESWGTIASNIEQH